MRLGSGRVALAPLEDTWQQFRPRLAAATTDWQRYPLYAAPCSPIRGQFRLVKKAPLPVWIYGLLAVVPGRSLAGALMVLQAQ